MDKEESSHKRNCFINIIITQAICIALVLCSVLIVKYFFKDEYVKVKHWYSENVATNTDIQEVLK